MPKGVYTRKPLVTDFSAYLEARSTPEPNSGCWIWLGAVGPHGYGTCMVNKVWWRSNRLAFYVHNGHLPLLLACHHCDVKLCVNPDHLYDGDYRSNTYDTMARSKTWRPPPTAFGPGKKQWRHR